MPNGTPLAFFAARTHCWWCSPWCPPGPTGSFLTSCLPAEYTLQQSVFPIYTGAWGCSSPGAGLCTLLFEFHEVPFLCRNGVSAIPPRFVKSANLLRTHCAPSSRSRSASQDAKQEQSQHWPLGFTAGCWAPNRFHAAVTSLWDQLFS